MPLIPLEIGTQSNYGRYGQDGKARLINGYAEELGKEGKHPYPIYAFPGLSDFATLTDGGAVRCMIDLDSYLYTVAGRAIYRIDTSGSGGSVPIGGLASDGHVTMARNRRAPNAQIAVVCDGAVKIITGTTVTDLGDSDLPPPNSVFPLSGYFVFTIPDGRYFWSEIDGSGIDALDFASAEANPDGLVIGKALGQTAVLFGSRSTEFHTLTGGAEVFARQHVINVGCYAAGSVAEIPIITPQVITDSLAFAATDRQGAYAGICVIENLSARKISNHAVDRAVRDEPNPLSITSCSWSDGGHAFYSISGSSFSWCWDSATGMWTERQSYGLLRWKVRSVQQFGGGLIAGDYTSNKLYRMSNTVYAEGSDPLIMTVQTPPVHAFPEALEFLALYIDVIPGVGIESEEAEATETDILAWDDEDTIAWDDGDIIAWDAVEAVPSTHNTDPEIMVSWSDDGINFTPPRFIKIGQMGETIKRVKTPRLGQSKRGGGGRTFRFSVSAAVVKGIMAASIDVNKIAA
jgi:hypothetical protein